MSELRDRQREETHRRVYEAALVFIRRDGAAACRVDDIVRAAGVSRGTFYFHYPSKDHVLLELAIEREGRIAADIDALDEDTPLREVLETSVAALATEWEGDPRLFPDTMSAVVRLTGVVSDVEALRVRTSLGARFRTAASRRELSDRLPPELLSDFFLTNIVGGLLGWCGFPVAPLRTILSTVIDLFLKGAAAPAKPRSTARKKPPATPRRRPAALPLPADGPRARRARKTRSADPAGDGRKRRKPALR